MIKIFTYIPELDCFVINPEYKKIANTLNLDELTWIGKYFLLEGDTTRGWIGKTNDKILEKQAIKLEINPADLLSINPEIFQQGQDDSHYSILERKGFWTDVLISLELSADTIFNEAIRVNNERDQKDKKYLSDIEQRIEKIRFVLISNEKS
jgi:hypothetical protein